MNTFTRRAAVAAMAAAVAVGANVPIASAGQHAHGKAGHASSAHKGGNVDRAGARLARDIAHADAALARIANSHSLAFIDPVLAGQVSASIAADRAAVATMTTRAQVRAVHATVYRQVLGTLKEIAEMQAALAVAPASDAVTAATDAVAASQQAVVTLTAMTSKAERHAVMEQMDAVEALFALAVPAVDDSLDPVDPVEPVEPTDPGDTVDVILGGGTKGSAVDVILGGGTKGSAVEVILGGGTKKG